jgi:hypothetical protein
MFFNDARGAERLRGLGTPVKTLRSRGTGIADTIPLRRSHYARGGVVQLVRTSPCHGEGRGFESRRSRHFFFRQISHF